MTSKEAPTCAADAFREFGRAAMAYVEHAVASLTLKERERYRELSEMCVYPFDALYIIERERRGRRLGYYPTVHNHRVFEGEDA